MISAASHTHESSARIDIGAFELQTVATPNLPGDYNGNQNVDAADFVIWRKTMGAAWTNTREPTATAAVSRRCRLRRVARQLRRTVSRLGRHRRSQSNQPAPTMQPANRKYCTQRLSVVRSICRIRPPAFGKIGFARRLSDTQRAYARGPLTSMTAMRPSWR